MKINGHRESFLAGKCNVHLNDAENILIIQSDGLTVNFELNDAPHDCSRTLRLFPAYFKQIYSDRKEKSLEKPRGINSKDLLQTSRRSPELALVTSRVDIPKVNDDKALVERRLKASRCSPLEASVNVALGPYSTDEDTTPCNFSRTSEILSATPKRDEIPSMNHTKSIPLLGDQQKISALPSSVAKKVSQVTPLFSPFQASSFEDKVHPL